MKLWIKMKEPEKIWLCINTELFVATSFVFRSLLAVWAVFIAVILGKCSTSRSQLPCYVSVILKWTTNLCWCGILFLAIGTRCSLGIGSWWVERKASSTLPNPPTTMNLGNLHSLPNLMSEPPLQWVRKSCFAITYRNLWEIINDGSHLETWAFGW